MQNIVGELFTQLMARFEGQMAVPVAQFAPKILDLTGDAALARCRRGTFPVPVFSVGKIPYVSLAQAAIWLADPKSTGLTEPRRLGRPRKVVTHLGGGAQ